MRNVYRKYTIKNENKKYFYFVTVLMKGKSSQGFKAQQSTQEMFSFAPFVSHVRDEILPRRRRGEAKLI